ncbi:class I SAM-dependent methyltransferase [Tabrizicola sp.]|uniref:class I SAM-dependent methyltransferase n=1 Tax=Tabrizicola sp. TaxID=2005166 RepID=UPI00286CBFF4|nr:class I SAM-dependent methyltransferase [Tabrizicola sp.]
MPASPYLAPDFYAKALAAGRHRDIVGGRWDETARAQMAALRAAGLAPHHRLLDIGCGALRLGHMAVPYLDPAHYWGTDASLALMQRGYEVELADKSRLPLSNLIEDADFAFPGIPADIDFAIAFGVFTHLPIGAMESALHAVTTRLPRLRAFLFSVFLAPEAQFDGPYRQTDGVVTHPDRAPRHVLSADLLRLCDKAGLQLLQSPGRLPRGQTLWVASPPQMP